MADPANVQRGRFGARWLNERPSPEDFAAWFRDNVDVDPKLDAEKYVGGIVLIPAVDTKAKHVKGFATNGAPIIEERAELAYVPYAKVETRIQYFWDLLDAHDEWVGVCQPVVTPRPHEDTFTEEATETRPDGTSVTTSRPRVPATAQIIQQLPEGFFLLPIPLGQGYSHFLCCTFRVAIYHRDDREWPIREGRGTKMVPLLLGRDTKYPDVNAIMKAETGAIGRAIAFAGIFNIPGSGVATAEDMIEAMNQGPVAANEEPAQAGGAGPAAPVEAAVRTDAERAEEDEEALKARAREIATRLQADFPEAFAEFGTWCHRRQPKITSLNSVKGAALRGVVKKLEKLHEEALAKQAARGEESAAEAPQDAQGAATPAAEDVSTDAPTDAPTDGQSSTEEAGGDGPEPSGS